MIDPRHRDGDNDGDDIHVVTNFKLTNNCAPTGSAIGPDNELFLACSTAAEQVIDLRDGR